MTRRFEHSEEIWKEFPLCNDYLISNIGRVKSIERWYNHPIRGIVYIPERILSVLHCEHGYQRTQISINRTKQKWYIHRLVAITFIENTDKKKEINHKNGIRFDNRVENLEWATTSENNLHSYRELGRKPSAPQTGKRGINHHASKPVNCPTLDMTFESARIAAGILGINQGSISHVCNGVRIHYNGLNFRYV